MMNQEEARKEISKEKGPNTPTFVLVHLPMTEELSPPLEDAPQHQLLCLKELSGGGGRKHILLGKRSPLHSTYIRPYKILTKWHQCCTMA